MPKIPKKRGRKPKIRTINNKPPVIGITEANENIIMHIPIQEDILLNAGRSSEENLYVYKPVVEDPRPYDPHEDSECSVNLQNNIKQYSKFFKLKKNPKVEKDKKETTKNNLFAKDQIKEVKVIKLDKHKNKQLKVTNGLRDFININSLHEWPKKTDIACWWDGHQFDNMPIGLPHKMVQNKLLVTGCFCSFECAMAYNLCQRDFKVSERTSLLKLLFRKLYPDQDDNIKYSPRKEVLQKFGGNLTIEEYRDNLRKPQKEVRVLMPPIISLAPQIEEIHLKKKTFGFKGRKKRRNLFP